MQQPLFYHAGRLVSVAAEQAFFVAIGRVKCDVDVLHLEEAPSHIQDAESASVKSMTAMVVGDRPLHNDFGASREGLKKWLDRDAI